VIAKSKPIRREAGVLKRGVGIHYGEIELRTSDVANPGAGIDANAVREGFQIWLTRSNAAFNRAISAVEEEGASSMGKDVTEDVIYILQRYASEASATNTPSNNSLSEMEQGFWRAKS